jgi:hypothetical protein
MTGYTGGPVRVAKNGLQRSHARGRRHPETQSYVEVVVRPDDELSFTRLLHQFSNLGDALFVDPWLKLGQFLEVAEYTPVTRILTTSRAFGSAAQQELYQRALSAVAGRIEVRHIDTLHDRHYIPDAGNIWMLGISLNGVAKNISVLTQLGEESSTVLRAAYEKFWSDATVLAPIQADPAETPASPTETVAVEK